MTEEWGGIMVLIRFENDFPKLLLLLNEDRLKCDLPKNRNGQEAGR